MRNFFAPSLPPKGITLLIAVILASVVLTVALTLLDVTYKQVVLASSATESAAAFANADSVMECTLYWDQQQDAFDYTNPKVPGSSIVCDQPDGTQITVTGYSSPNPSGGNPRVTVFTVPCPSGGTEADVTVSKASNNNTILYSTGYSSCTLADPKRIARGLRAQY